MGEAGFLSLFLTRFPGLPAFLLTSNQSGQFVLRFMPPTLFQSSRAISASLSDRGVRRVVDFQE